MSCWSPICTRTCTYVHYLHTLAVTRDEFLLVFCVKHFMCESDCFVLPSDVAVDDVLWCSRLHCLVLVPNKFEIGLVPYGIVANRNAYQLILFAWGQVFGLRRPRQLCYQLEWEI